MEDEIGVFIRDSTNTTYFAPFVGQLETAVRDFKEKASFAKGEKIQCVAKRFLSDRRDKDHIEFVILPSASASA